MRADVSVIMPVLNEERHLRAAVDGVLAQDHPGELEVLLRVLHLMPVTYELVSAAAELADVEGLRGYDAVHLAAAFEIGATVLSSADAALCAAAERRGLHVANPLTS